MNVHAFTDSILVNSISTYPENSPLKTTHLRDPPPMLSHEAFAEISSPCVLALPFLGTPTALTACLLALVTDCI